jgi:hypothetical protein
MCLELVQLLEYYLTFLVIMVLRSDRGILLPPASGKFSYTKQTARDLIQYNTNLCTNMSLGRVHLRIWFTGGRFGRLNSVFRCFIAITLIHFFYHCVFEIVTVVMGVVYLLSVIEFHSVQTSKAS